MTELPKRKPTRLKEYDYSKTGAYFVTVCTHNKEHLLSNPLKWELDCFYEAKKQAEPAP